jgi:hypothetical protein
MGRVSVPFCPFPLSGRVPVIGLVGHYPTNCLMGDRLIRRRAVKRFSLAGSCGISSAFAEVFHTIGEIPIHYSAVRNSLLAELVLLACIRHAASVNPGPGSNPQIVSIEDVNLRWTILLPAISRIPISNTNSMKTPPNRSLSRVRIEPKRRKVRWCGVEATCM